MPELGFTDLLGFCYWITPVVYFHELGHYWVARKAGVVVDVFQLALDLKFTAGLRNRNRWRLSVIRLVTGKCVAMMMSRVLHQIITKVPCSFSNAGLYWRMAIVAAGPTANFLLGILLFAAVYMFVGKQTIPAVVGEVMPNTPAASAGLFPGDKVLEIDGIGVRDFNDMRGLVVESPGKALSFVINVERVTWNLRQPEPHFNEQLQIFIGVLGVKSLNVGEFQRLGLTLRLKSLHLMRFICRLLFCEV